MTCLSSNMNRTLSSEATNDTTSSFSLSPEPEAWRVIRTVLFSLIAALALVGNYVVCRAVWRHTGAKPIAHYLVSNLAFAEIVSTVCLVLTFHAREPPWSWKLGLVMCKILPPLQIASQLITTTTLATLAVYRCVLLTKPLIHKPTRKQIYGYALVCWVGSVVLVIPAGYFRVLNSWDENCELFICQEVFPESLKHYQDVYSIILFVVNFALPFVIMALSYSLVRKKIREHIFVVQRLRDEQSNALSSATQPSSFTEEIQATGDINQIEHENQMTFKLVKMEDGVNTEKVIKKPQRRVKFAQKISRKKTFPQTLSTKNCKTALELENDLLRMVYALVLVFVVCYIPYQIQFLLMEFNVKAFMYWPNRYIFDRLVYTLTCLPSALHPVFYGMMSQFYRKAFIRMIACRDSK